MYLIRGIGNIETFNRKFPNQSMSGTIGNFDGLHLGHQAILNQVKDKARESSSASLVFLQSRMHLSILQLKMKILQHLREFALGEKK